MGCGYKRNLDVAVIATPAQAEARSGGRGPVGPIIWKDAAHASGPVFCRATLSTGQGTPPQPDRLAGFFYGFWAEFEVRYWLATRRVHKADEEAGTDALPERPGGAPDRRGDRYRAGHRARHGSRGRDGRHR